MDKARTEVLIELAMPDGTHVRGICCSGEGGNAGPVVVFAHGFGSTWSGEKAFALEAECVRRGWAFVAFDFRGHGQSEGSMTDLRGARLIQDLDAVARWAARRMGGPLFLFGSSMGGWAAAWLSANAPECVTACAFVAPAFHFLEWGDLSKEELEEWRRTGRRHFQNEGMDIEVGYGLAEESSTFPVSELAQKFVTPLVIFHGLRDEVVSYSSSIDFAVNCAASNVEIHLLKEGDHRLNLAKEELARGACDFFARSLSSLRNS
jgi:pimeloyl-ACP methyl ester carboxylesterase